MIQTNLVQIGPMFSDEKLFFYTKNQCEMTDVSKQQQTSSDDIRSHDFHTICAKNTLFSRNYYIPY